MKVDGLLCWLWRLLWLWKIVVFGTMEIELDWHVCWILDTDGIVYNYSAHKQQKRKYT